jgi:hypothetical protein
MGDIAHGRALDTYVGGIGVSGRLRALRLAIGVTTAVGAMLITPVAASAGPVEDLVNQVSSGVNSTLDNLLGGGGGGGGGGGAPSADRTPAPAGTGGDTGYVPPAHGTNPHAQGTGAVVDLTPDDARPLAYDPAGGDEEIVLGASRSEQNGDAYHGHVTILSLLGTELLEGADTDPGETDDGPLGDLNALLADVCADTGLCLAVLDVNSETTATGSSNSFAVARASLGFEDTQLLDAEAVSSESTISDDGTCQTASSGSELADASLAEGELAGVQAADSGSESQACNDGTSSQSQEGDVDAVGELEVLGQVVEIPLFNEGCHQGTPNTLASVFDLGVVDVGVCNADDSSNTGGTQNDSPFGVREGLTVLPGLLGIDLGELAKVTSAASESQAVAPPAEEEPPPGGNPPGGSNQDDAPSGVEPGGPDECPDPDNPDCPTSLAGPGGPSADSPDNLPFTGADMLSLGLIGLLVMGTGLGLMALVDRRRRIGEQG